MAALLIGQPDTVSSDCINPSISGLTLCNPSGLGFDGTGALWAADTGDSRVLRAPVGLAVDANGNLYVADAGNNRVVEFDSPFTKDTFADRVYGQNGDMFTNLCNLGAASPTADTLCSPAGVAIDAAGNLWISDSSNNRVVEFNTPLTNMTADMVFGQDGVPTTGDCNLGNSPGPDTLCNPLALSLIAAAIFTLPTPTTTGSSSLTSRSRTARSWPTACSGRTAVSPPMAATRTDWIPPTYA